MSVVSLSIWLPVSRANFYSFTETDWLGTDGTGTSRTCWSKRLEARPLPGQDPYVPLMLVGVLRRLLEVMPESFDYGRRGTCAYRGDTEARQRPVSLQMTLDLTGGCGEEGESRRWAANRALVDACVSEVRLDVDENGSYAFTATYGQNADVGAVRAALATHIREVFGGTYTVHPIPVRSRRVNPGDRSLKQYNGLLDQDGREVVETKPRGALNFGQLHILAEGLWNDMLAPAIYLEQRTFMQEYFDGPESKEFLRSVADVIGALTTETDASEPLGQIAVLHHFLTITSHGSLQKLTSALESVRRRLLDEMMGALHRQNRLVQLNFSANARERRPELAVNATESQLKGYATLVSAKLPLILGVREMARLATEHLTWVVRESPEVKLRTEAESATLSTQIERLDGQVRHWNTLLDDLSSNVRSLETTIEHAWMDRLLYEQEQVRSEQELTAEIERSRQSRPTGQRPGRAAYNLVMMLLAAAAVVFTVSSTNVQTLGRSGWLHVVVTLWPVWAVALIAFVVVPVYGHRRRISKEKRGLLTSYPYEFAFTLNELVDPAKLLAHVRATKPRRLATATLGDLTMTTRGYGRVEKMSADTTIVKVHSAAAFPARWQYARFEVISEILVHKISEATRHLLLQCRIFGESPEALQNDEVFDLLKTILQDLVDRIAEEDRENPDDVNERFDATNLLESSLYLEPPSTGPAPDRTLGG